MLRLFMLITVSLFLTAASNAAFARPGEGGRPGGMSDDHMSTQGMTNTNGPESSDRDKGRDRAEDRRNQEVGEHEKHGHEHGHGGHDGDDHGKGGHHGHGHEHGGEKHEQ